jgi:hypothetical protein
MHYQDTYMSLLECHSVENATQSTQHLYEAAISAREELRNHEHEHKCGEPAHRAAKS